MKIIVAADKNWGIGKDNKLLVSIPADMKMFRQETTGKERFVLWEERPWRVSQEGFLLKTAQTSFLPEMRITK